MRFGTNNIVMAGPGSNPGDGATQPACVRALNGVTEKREPGSPRARAMTFADGWAKASFRLLIAFALVLPAAGCGTKTELLMPNGKPTPRDQRDPSQPPSPISR